MNKRLEKASLITIIVLLVIFLPLTGYSMYLKNNPKEKTEKPKENVNKEPYFDNSYWVYNEEKELLGTYPCKTKNCSLGTSYENDEKYVIDYKKSENKTSLPVIKEQYVFMSDNEESDSNKVYFYDLKNPTYFKDVSYASVKNYQVGLSDNMFIVENEEHKFGVLQITDTPLMIIPFSYDFIGVINEVGKDELLLTDYFITLKDNSWYIIDKNEAVLTKEIKEPIVTFNGKYIITKSDSYHLKNYDGVDVLEDNYKNLFFVDKYICIVTEDSELYLYDIEEKSYKSSIHTLNENDEYDVTINNKKISITINDDVVEEISI